MRKTSRLMTQEKSSEENEMENEAKVNDILSVFGLTGKQTALLFSLQKSCALKCADSSKSQEDRERKRMWTDKWSASIKGILAKENQPLIEEIDLIQEFQKELRKSNSKIWFHLIILEAVTFKAYTPLGNTEEDKIYSRLHYDRQIEYIKNIILLTGYGKPEMAEKYLELYEKAEDRAAGKTQKIIINVISVVMVGALCAATASLLAGPIAVFLVGGQFAGLHGAALVSACLAFLGGGAIAAGGAGMAGGAMVLCGGGALLGVAAGGAAVATKETLFSASPELALTLAAKLDVVLREIILNEQKDIKIAQKVLESYKENILALNMRIASLELENEKNEAQIKNLKKAVEYMEKIFRDMNRFTSSFEVGLNEGEVK